MFPTGARLASRENKVSAKKTVPLPLKPWHPWSRYLPPVDENAKTFRLVIGYIVGAGAWTPSPLADGSVIRRCRSPTSSRARSSCAARPRPWNEAPRPRRDDVRRPARRRARAGARRRGRDLSSRLARRAAVRRRRRRADRRQSIRRSRRPRGRARLGRRVDVSAYVPASSSGARACSPIARRATSTCRRSRCTAPRRSTPPASPSARRSARRRIRCKRDATVRRTAA